MLHCTHRQLGSRSPLILTALPGTDCNSHMYTWQYCTLLHRQLQLPLPADTYSTTRHPCSSLPIYSSVACLSLHDQILPILFTAHLIKMHLRFTTHCKHTCLKKSGPAPQGGAAQSYSCLTGLSCRVCNEGPSTIVPSDIFPAPSAAT